jgi:hypothetical protein
LEGECDGPEKILAYVKCLHAGKWLEKSQPLAVLGFIFPIYISFLEDREVFYRG